MNKKSLLDATLVALLLLTTVSGFGGMGAMVHCGASVLLLVGSIVHIAWHWKWIEAVIVRRPRKLTARTRAQRRGNILLGVAFVLCSASGLMAWLNPSLRSLATWSNLHQWSGIAMFLLTVLHVAQYRKRSAPTARRRAAAGLRD
jgi:hypothetical protein